MVRCLAFAATFILAGSAIAQTCPAHSCFEASVVAVADGDTVTVLRQTAAGPRQVRVRLTEIDAPERGQPWGTRARRALADKVFRQTVQVVASGEDRYGRMLARLYVADGDTLSGRDVNREMVREGHAWVYRRYATENWLPDEAAARDSGLGLWSLGVGASVPPWEWRHGERHRSVAAIEKSPAQNAESFSCGTKRICREMISCAEARFHLVTCGLRTLDGDRDGEPCEKLCRKFR
ncbi:MAG: thermonuclease family protein [Gammaproteobacteria bacterium]|nr:thermonuclease family protein [Gammaproteobacteria bacterium]